MKKDYTIRFAEQKDIKEIVGLCKLHAEYELAEYFTEGKEEKLLFDIFSEHPKIYCLVVEYKNTIIGYASYMKQYSTWDANEYFYMDCIYIVESRRSEGIGKKLIERIVIESRKMNCEIIQWQTPNFNKRAMKFYNKIGAKSKSKERFFLKIH